MSIGSPPDPAPRLFDGARAFANVESRQVQPLFREVNEQILLIAEDSAARGTVEVVCECANPSCFATFEIALDEYEAVRRFPTRFVVKPRHDSAESERIVLEASNFFVVEKHGPAARAAIRLDPRRRRLAAIHTSAGVERTSRGARRA
jgi:hypothetical protein